MARTIKRKNRKKKSRRLLIILIILLGIGFGLYYYGYFDKFLNKNTVIKPVKKLKILDLDSNTRPYAVMIDNVYDARPQSGLDKAYLTYEIIVEGGLTRLMAVFKDVDVKEIGPVRSARHYFVDYALENDAIFVHHGRSPQALSRINKYNVNDLEGLYNPSNVFWRDNSRYAPHNSYISTNGIKKSIDAKEYRTKSNDWQVFNYSVDEINLSNSEEAKKADKVVINFSMSTYTTLEYDSANKVYKRYESGKAHSDRSGKQYTTKNLIIVMGVKNYTIDYSTGRQDINNVGSGDGYFITNGYAVPIKWEKTSISEKTTYKYSNGKKIKLNDGNTYVEIQPLGQKLDIIGNTESSSK